MATHYALSALLLFVPVLPQAFLALMGGHFMSFSFFSAWHNMSPNLNFYRSFHFTYKFFGRLESRNAMRRDDDAGVL